MKIPYSTTELYRDMESSLIGSNAEKRNLWALSIIENKIELKELSNLLAGEKKVALRFLWFMSEVGLINPNKLFIELPYLMKLFETRYPTYLNSLASYWHIAGIPPENEGKAVDYLFQWLRSAETNVTIKSRSLWVLHKLSKKYPDLKNELQLCIEDQMYKHSKDFAKRANKILNELYSE